MITFPGNYLRMAGKTVEYSVEYRPSGFTKITRGALVDISELDFRDHTHLAPGEEAYSLVFDRLGINVEVFGDKGVNADERLRVINEREA